MLNKIQNHQSGSKTTTLPWHTYLGITYTYFGIAYTCFGITYTFFGITCTYFDITYTYFGITYKGGKGISLTSLFLRLRCLRLFFFFFS